MRPALMGSLIRTCRKHEYFSWASSCNSSNPQWGKKGRFYGRGNFSSFLLLSSGTFHFPRLLYDLLWFLWLWQDFLFLFTVCKFPVSLNQAYNLSVFCKPWSRPPQGFVFPSIRSVIWLGRCMNQGTQLQVTKRPPQNTFIKKKYVCQPTWKVWDTADFRYSGVQQLKWELEISLCFSSLLISVYVSTLGLFFWWYRKAPSIWLGKMAIKQLKFKSS